MTHVEKYSFYFKSEERAKEAISDLNTIFCKNLNFCLSISCGCEFENKDRVCKTYTIDSDFERNIFLNEGPSWTMIYMQNANNLFLHLYNYGNLLENEIIELKKDLSKFQSKEANKTQ